jgi:hypothetical protein
VGDRGDARDPDVQPGRARHGKGRHHVLFNAS